MNSKYYTNFLLLTLHTYTVYAYFRQRNFTFTSRGISRMRALGGLAHGPVCRMSHRQLFMVYQAVFQYVHVKALCWLCPNLCSFMIYLFYLCFNTELSLLLSTFEVSRQWLITCGLKEISAQYCQWQPRSLCGDLFLWSNLWLLSQEELWLLDWAKATSKTPRLTHQSPWNQPS